MKKVKTIITYILTIIITVLIVRYFTLNLLSATLFNEKYILSKLEKANYFEKVYKQLDSNFENYIKQSGLDESVIKDIVTLEKVENDTKSIVRNLYNGTDEEISTDDISDKLNENIKKSLNYRALSKEEDEAINKFIEIICKEYESTILHLDYETSISNRIVNIIKNVKNINKILLTAIGVSIIMVLLINLKKVYKTVNALGISFTASGLILIVAKLFVNSKVEIDEITLLNNEFTEILRSVLSEMVSKVLLYGTIFVIVGVMLIISSNLIHNIRKYGLKEKVEKWKK